MTTRDADNLGAMSGQPCGLELRKDGALQVRVSGEPIVERDQLITGHLCEGGQECVVPDLGCEGLALCVAAPDWIYSEGFVSKRNARVAQTGVIQSPRARQGYGVFPASPSDL